MKIIRYLLGLLILLWIGLGLCSIPVIIPEFADETATLHPVSQGGFYSVFAYSFLIQILCAVAVIRLLTHGNNRRWSRILLYVPLGFIAVGFLWPIPLFGEGIGLATGIALWPIPFLMPAAFAFLAVILMEEKRKNRPQQLSIG